MDEAAAPGDSTSTTEPGRVIDAGRGRIYPCAGCGADLEFHVGQQRLVCPFCGDEREIVLDESAAIEEQDFAAMLARLVELRAARRDAKRSETTGAADAPDAALNEVRCLACGSSVLFPGTLTSTDCAFCGSPVQRDDVHRAEDRVPADGVLPFRVDRATAQARLAQWVGSRWFAPGDFKRTGARGRFAGIYLPFWTFDSHTFTRYRGERGEHYWVTVGSGKNRRRVRRTRWYPASGAFERFFDDVLVAATTEAMPSKFMHALEPWPLDGCLPFTPQVLAGFLARTYDLELDVGFEVGRERMAAALRSDVRGRIGGDEQRIHQMDVRHDPVTYKHLLLPAWLLAYRYRDRTFRVIVNAATGEVQGERPWSAWKIAFAVLGAVAVAGIAALVARAM